MIDCPNGDVRDVLPEYLHERLEPRARAAVASHLAACETCSAELALLASARRGLSAAPAVDVDRIVAALPRGSRRVAAVHALPGRERSTSHLRRVPVLAAAAALLLAAGLIGVDRLTSRGALVAAGEDAAVLAEPVGPFGEGASPPSDAPTLVAAERAPLPELTFAGGLSDLSAGDLEELIAELDAIDGLPALEPQPVLLALPVEAAGDA